MRHARCVSLEENSTDALGMYAGEELSLLFLLRMIPRGTLLFVSLLDMASMFDTKGDVVVDRDRRQLKVAWCLGVGVSCFLQIRRLLNPLHLYTT